MSKINLPYKYYISYDIVNLIADFHDYEKYCKPLHHKKYKSVLDDIADMGTIMPNGISPYISIQCWGIRGICQVTNELNYESDEEQYFNDFEYEGGGWYN